MSHTAIETVPGLGMSESRLRRIPELLRSYLDNRALAGYAVLVARGGDIAFRTEQGVMDWDSGKPLASDTIYRVYSMSKPITSVALMMLYEEGLIRLEHPVSRYIPEFEGLQVFDLGDPLLYRTRAPQRAMLVHDLLRHTSGLTYDFLHQHAVDALYRKAGLSNPHQSELTLESWCSVLATLPLLYSPGERWNYSVSTDVCGRLVEIVSGLSLEQFMEQRIFGPLGMTDTAFSVPDSRLDRFASCYEKVVGKRGVRKQDDALTSPFRRQPSFYSGGGGLVSTMDDYWRFCRMLFNGGELDGQRLLSRKTIEFMTMNHLPGNRTMIEMGDTLFTETRMEGSGFGLGFSVVLDPVRCCLPVSAGTYSWGGMASTYFWIDPAEELVGILMTQLMPSNSYPIRPQLQTLVYAALE